jgi:hypothetical protein
MRHRDLGLRGGGVALAGLSRFSTNESVRVKRDPHRLRGLTAPPNIAMYVAGNLRLFVADRRAERQERAMNIFYVADCDT